MENKRNAVTKLVHSIASMSKDERKCSLLTALSLCEHFSAAPKSANTDAERQRVQFDYFLPFIGKVCKGAFEAGYGVSNRSLVLLRKQVSLGDISVVKHGGVGNVNAQLVDSDMLTRWFKRVADEMGEPILVRVRLTKQEGGRLKRYYSYCPYIMLPAPYTWDKLLAEFLQWAEDCNARFNKPSRSSFIEILKQRCPTIRIRSPHDQVCDQCRIYRARMQSQPTTDETEVFADHVNSAKVMR